MHTILTIQAYPLNWPPGRPRSTSRQYARFDVSLDRSVRDCRAEVSRLGGRDLIISTNIPLRRDGLPYSNYRVTDPGVAVYFTYKKKQVCFACDQWLTIDDNMRAIVKTIEALRGIERWGSGDMMDQAFTGFTALPAPEQPFQVLGVSANATRSEVERAYRALASKHHPDRGGDEQTMARINAARDAML